MAIDLYIYINKSVVKLGLAAFIAMVGVSFVDCLIKEKPYVEESDIDE